MRRAGPSAAGLCVVRLLAEHVPAPAEERLARRAGPSAAGLCVVRLLAGRVPAPAVQRLVRRAVRLQGSGGGVSWPFARCQH